MNLSIDSTENKKNVCFVLKPYLLAKSNHCSLHVQRIRKLLCEVYKIVSNISPNIVSDIFQIKNTIYLQKDKTSGDTSCKTVRYGINSLRYQRSKIWNELPNDIKNATDLNLFKNMISNWNGHTCNCDICT